MSAASTTRVRFVAFALASLIGASAIGCWLRTESAQPAAPAVAPTASTPLRDSVGGAHASPARLAGAPETEPRSDLAMEASRTSAGARIDLRVVGANGERAQVESWFRASSETDFVYASHETDGEGRVVLSLPPGSLRLTAGTKTRASARHSVEIKARAVAVELPLLGLATITGRVTHAGEHGTIGGAKVHAPAWTEVRFAVSGADGRYELALPAEGEHDHEIHCEAAGFAREISIVHVRPGDSWSATVNVPGQYPKEVALESAAARVDFELLLERTIIGSVHVASIPVPGASVQAAGWLRIDRHSVPDDAVGHSNSDGSFALYGLRPDVEHVLVVRHPEYADLQLRVPPGIEALRDVGALELAAPHELVVMALDSHDVPVEDITVSLDTAVPTAPGMRHPGPGRFKRNGHDPHIGDEVGQRRTQSGADGSARFSALPAGDYAVNAYDGVRFFTYREAMAVHLEADTRVTFEIPHSGPIAGRVFAANEPVSGARVTLTGHASRRTTSKPDGSFSITGNRVGPAYRLRATWIDQDGHEWSSAEIPADWNRPNAIALTRAP